MCLDASALGYGEQLVLWASRRWFADRLGWDKVEQEFAIALGCARGRLALDALDELLRATSSAARRTAFLHRLDCRRISADEHALLTVVAALQAGQRGHATALLEWLLHEDAVHAATSPAATLAAALEESGIVLPLRPTHGTTTLSADEKRTGALH